MAGQSKSRDLQDAQIVLGLLESVERNGAQSQRRLATELGIALDLVKAYLKRCVKRGSVKISAARGSSLAAPKDIRATAARSVN